MSTNASQEQLILFTRYPQAGSAKTRLIPALGPEGAAALQRRLTEGVVEEVERLRQRRSVSFEIHFAGGSLSLVEGWLASGDRCRPQPLGDLGHRLQCAFASAFAAGFRRVVLVGSDCPALSAPVLERAFDALRDHDLVLGPATDGGYYLVGLCGTAPFLFSEMAWGESSVLLRTLNRAAAVGLRVALLETLSDVDRPEDLAHFRHYSNS